MSPSITALFPAETSSPEETRALGESLAPMLSPGDVVALYGDLGAGKTQFVKGICRALDIDQTTVSSPTFTIAHEYDGLHPVYHLDMYRIDRLEEAIEFGFRDYVDGDGVCLIEWPENVERLLPAGTIRIRLRHQTGDRRLIDVSQDFKPISGSEL
jgi:tRNA threonylcarbamoyladenosine biosynthesis protein TsaE